MIEMANYKSYPGEETLPWTSSVHQSPQVTAGSWGFPSLFCWMDGVSALTLCLLAACCLTLLLFAVYLINELKRKGM